MAFRNRTRRTDSISSGDETSQNRIRESVQRLWFSIQKYVQKLDAAASPSDYLERAEDLAACRLTAADEMSLDGLIKGAFRDVAYSDRRAKLRRQAKFGAPDSTGIESIADPNSEIFAAVVVEKSHQEWQIDEIRRRLDPEIMRVIEQLYGFHSDQWTIDNLAKKMGIKKNTLEQRLSRAFAKLRSELPFSE